MRVNRIASFSVPLLALLFFNTAALAHEEQTPVILDTDMGLDDVRALALMLSLPQLEVMAMVTGDGASCPDAGLRNLRCVLSFLGREDIPIAAGKALEAPAPPWREMSDALGWTKLCDAEERRSEDLTQGMAGEGQEVRPDAVSLIIKTLAEADQQVTYIAMGPLTNLAQALRAEPSTYEHIGSIIYYGLPPGASRPDWNTSRDVEAAQAVFSSGIPILAMQPRDEDLLAFDAPLLAEIRRFDSPASRLIGSLFEDERVNKVLAQDHFKVWDDTIALYVDAPRLGSFEPLSPGSPVIRLIRWDKAAARTNYIDILSRSANPSLSPRNPVILATYPSDPALFQDDLRPLVTRIISLHGIEEWKAAVLTNEIHRHLGIYSIVGVKMGILAREVLHASLDQLKVESHAGLAPPLSCLNDGLQVSTGASLGRGTITVAEKDSPAAEAVFEAGNKKLRLRLQDSVRDRIRTDIQSIISRYGDLTPEYFKEVRRLSLEYWAEMKRGEIFERDLSNR